MRIARIALLLAAVVLLGAAVTDDAGDSAARLRAAYSGPVATWPKAEVDPGVEFREFGALPPRPTLDDKQRKAVALGERLFNERQLSASGQFACASCHVRELGFGDGHKTSFGHDRQRGERNAQGLLTAAFMEPLFWDGRSPSLEHQALQPIANPIEMAANSRRVEQWINRQQDYRDQFRMAYGVERIRMTDIAQAMADFQRTLRPPRSLWDRALAEGGKVLNDQQILGLHLFRTKARCANCHNGPLLSDLKFHNLGISFYGRELEDVGRYGVTGDPIDVGRFRTPSLRAITRTAPYMHNGIFPHLEGIVNIYAAGGGVDRKVQSSTTKAPPPQPDPLLRKLELTREERAAVVAFLETL